MFRICLHTAFPIHQGNSIGNPVLFSLNCLIVSVVSVVRNCVLGGLISKLVCFDKQFPNCFTGFVVGFLINRIEIHWKSVCVFHHFSTIN